MYHLAYFSTSTQHFSENDLNELLVTSQKNNQQINITGILLFIEGCFLQILEGNKDTVQTLYKKVKEDTRHDDVIKIFDGEKQERSFDKWSMGFKNLPFIDYKKQTGFEDLSNQDFIDNVIKKGHPKVVRTLEIFYNGGL